MNQDQSPDPSPALLDNLLRTRYAAQLEMLGAAELGRLGGRGVSNAKRRWTVIQIVVAEMFNESWDKPDFWKRPDVLSKGTWGKQKRQDPHLVPVLTALRGIAPRVRLAVADELTEEAVALIRQESLASVQRIATLRDSADADAVKLSAAKDLLDRNPRTARNRHSVLSGPDGGPVEVDNVGLTDGERAAGVMALFERARARRDRQAAEAEDGAADAPGVDEDPSP